MNECLGIKVKYQKDGSIRLSHLHLIKRIIETSPGMTSANPIEAPSIPKTDLTKDADG